MDYSLLQTDVLIIGGGVSGLTTALRLVEQGIKVLLVTQKTCEQSTSSYHYSSLAALFNPELYAIEILKHGEGLGDKILVSGMAQRAAEILNRLERWGVLFERSAEGHLARFATSVHTKAINVKVVPRLGFHLLKVLQEQLRSYAEQGLFTLQEDIRAVRILKDVGGTAQGAVLLNQLTGEFLAVSCKKMVCATGGYASLWGEKSATDLSDGVFLAELYAEGAMFVSPELIHFSDRENNQVGATLGGLWVSPDHQTTIDGLFAVGSCVANYHGALLDQGHALLASLSGAFRTASVVARQIKDKNFPIIRESFFIAGIEKEKSFLDQLLKQEGPYRVKALSAELATVLSKGVSFLRHNHIIKEALLQLESIEKSLPETRLVDRSLICNPELVQLYGFARQVLLARLILTGSLLRDETRGDFCKPSFPEKNDRSFLKRLRCFYEKGKPRFEWIDAAGESL